MQQLLDEISGQVEKTYRDAVDPLGEKYAFEKRPPAGEISGPPTVLFLGNHSSGKSTFINYLLDAQIQKSGLAPTDDSFTVLKFGANEEEREGQAVVSNPELPYQSLQHFGSDFVSHFKVKFRPISLLREINLVDSPGMIDAAKEGSGRGYDFPGAVRWFAERADVVLVFFDPDKPGTTGETLQVFTQSLHGIDHKLLIVMNKMDLFRSLHDFARAYGALCWNLGKVIPRKDLPHIFTTFVPVPNAQTPELPTKDFEQARDELVREVKRAPARRVDNMLTQLQDHAQRLLLQARIINEAGKDLRRFRFKLGGLLFMIFAVACLAGGVSVGAGVEWWVTAIIFGGAAVLLYGGYFLVRGLVRSEGAHLIEGLLAIFERLYARELLVRDRVEDLRALWNSVHGRTKQALEKLGILAFPRLQSDDEERLRKAVEDEIPHMRLRLHRELGGSRH